MSPKPIKRKQVGETGTAHKIQKSQSFKETEPSSNILKDIEEARVKCAQSVSEFKFSEKRIRLISSSKDISKSCKGIVYWMSRDQRVQDNWALLYAQKVALGVCCPLYVCFCLVPKFLNATIRHYQFVLKGLQEVEKECESLNIGFHLLLGEAYQVLPNFIKKNHIGAVVVDFSPLRTPLKWVDDVKKTLSSETVFWQVDAHNIVPCWEASEKLEYGARTIRRKIHDKLSTYLTEFPPVICHPHPCLKSQPVDWKAAQNSLQVDQSVKEVKWATPGAKEGLKMLFDFCKVRLKNFSDSRNDPTKNSLSNLSPWIHFGQISVQRCILTVKQFKNKYSKSVDAYIEEAIVRRELADNFCFFNSKYDQVEGAYDWAKTSLKLHAKDKREYIYTKEQFEKGQTHDSLWNAAQFQMVCEGKMHGFLRMYWAKKILEWSRSPEEALEIAIYLNDKYELDGRDPNGYVGCMWSICGIHDQGWAERPVFGKIRYMNYQGCKRKFDVDAFIRKYPVKEKA
ncbi:deoxyribodipyrimidine photo-lyase-like [Tachypleus tridentatus]|uniref:deoxyribodipyrimidine photo-lyase-like n=1 Tax=Tachypleus tridentatus TaxID=6853 RepID=UPI003FD69D90